MRQKVVIHRWDRRTLWGSEYRGGKVVWYNHGVVEVVIRIGK